MRRFRWAYLALLLIFAGTVIGMQFHSHPAGQDQIAAHCKSCQVSQTSYDTVQFRELLVTQPVLHSAEFKTPVLHIEELQNIASSRAPPLA